MPLILLLTFFASSGGAGAVASALFDALRYSLPLPAQPPISPVARLGYHLLYAPRSARLTVLLLAGLIGALASALMTWTQGVAFLESSPAVGGMVAALVSQIYHTRFLSGTVPFPTPPEST